MASIDPTTQLATLLAQQLRGKVGRLSGSVAAQATEQAQTGDETQRAHTEKQSASHTERGFNAYDASLEKVRALGQDEPRRKRRVFRIFMENTLLDELGPEMVNDGGFQQLVDRVVTEMAADVQLQPLMDQLADQLWATAHPDSPPDLP